ncbi:MAG TPA: SUMF1/EgtB/PvdO family nonheme iron enzyme, partial [Polyangiaceae bacterium]
MTNRSIHTIGKLRAALSAPHVLVAALTLVACGSSGGSGGGTASAGTSGDPSGGGAGGGDAGSAFSCASTAAPGDMVSVSAGDFIMGCNAAVDNECLDDEKPMHTVTLSAFQIDRTEVTQEQYAACVTAGSCAAPSCSWD